MVGSVDRPGTWPGSVVACSMTVSSVVKIAPAIDTAGDDERLGAAEPLGELLAERRAEAEEQAAAARAGRGRRVDGRRIGRSCRHLLLVDEAQEDGLEVERLLLVADEGQAGVDREPRDRAAGRPRVAPSRVATSYVAVAPSLGTSATEATPAIARMPASVVVARAAEDDPERRSW